MNLLLPTEGRRALLARAKVINELRDFSREENQHAYDVHMCDFLGVDPALYEELTGSAKTG